MALSLLAPACLVSADLGTQIAEQSPAVTVVAAAADFRIVYANRAAHLAARTAAGELIGKIATEAFPFIDPTLPALKTQARAQARSVPDRQRGETQWWDVSYVALEASPEAAFVLITAVDVTHHQRARAEAEAARDTLDALLAYIPEGISIAHGPEIHVDRISARGMAMLGRSADELTGRSALQQTDVWEVYRPGSDVPLPPGERPLARATRTGEIAINETLIVRRANGDMLTLVCNSGPIRDADGRVTGALMAWQDATELQRAQAAIRAGNERLRAVLLQIPAAIFIVEAPDGRVTFKSRLVDELLSHPDADLAAAKAMLRGWAVHRDGSPYDLSEYPSRRALFRGETIRAEPMLYYRGDGKLIDLEMHAGPVLNEAGEIIAAVAVALDVTDRHLAEARQAFLFQLQDSLRTLTAPKDILTAAATHLGRHLGAARVGFAEMQPDDESILVTNGYADGVPPVSGTFPLCMLGPHITERMRQGQTIVYRDLQADEPGARELSLQLGTRAHISVPLVRNGRYTGSLYVTHSKAHEWTTEEITLIEDVAARIWDAAERGRAEARLRASEDAAIETAAKFETLAQTMPSMVWTSLPDGRIDWFNARVPEYCGIPAADMKPDGWSPVHPDDMATATSLWLEAVASGNPYVSEYRIRRHDGMFRWHITRAIPVRGADGTITRWVGTSADIQDQKTSEQALADLNATLEQQVRERTAELLAAEATLRQSQKMEAVGQLTGGLAHDFNNLLTGITGSLELMATRLHQGKVTELDRYLHLAQGAAKRAAALTHRLLAFSRRQTLDPKPTDINQLVDGMDELIRRTVGPAVSVQVAGNPGLWPVLADPNQLENALLNLCINARDAMPDGGSLVIDAGNHVLDGAEAKRLELQAGEYVTLCVSDTGGGMTPDVIERAFDPFFTTKPMGEGTGLGLSMVYGFVRQSGGQARIHSQPGKGTRVCLYLPRYAGDDRVFEASPGLRDALRGDGETVLVVDDESSVRTLINEVLSELGYHVLEAEHGAAGLRILESSHRVDLLVTDVGLPGGMNGRQLADAALVTRPNLKILFITGYAENAVIGEGHLKPGMHILTKPFSLETLGSRIREIIAAV